MSQDQSADAYHADFKNLIREIPDIGLDRHGSKIVEHCKKSLPYFKQSIRDLPKVQGSKSQSAIVVSAGPSVVRRKSMERIKESGYEGAIIAVEASYVACLRNGVVPDYLLSLDPHPTRMARWIGDHDYEKNNLGDDYYRRQDLDLEFRKVDIQKNLENIDLVNRMAPQTKAIIATSAPPNFVERVREAGFDTYWWNPLVDNPRSPESITRQLYELSKLPSMNTGGNVGTAAWIFASEILGIPNVGMVGMDFGYYSNTPYNKTQTYYKMVEHVGGEDEKFERYFPKFEFPIGDDQYYCDPTYFWYRKNFLDLVSKVQAKTYNCTEGGTLFGEGIKCVNLDTFIREIARS